MSPITPDSPAALGAQQRIILHALTIVAADYEEPHRHSGDEAEYLADQLALACRDLVQAIEALPPADRPQGFRSTDPDVQAGLQTLVEKELTYDEVHSIVLRWALEIALVPYTHNDPAHPDARLAVAARRLVRMVEKEPPARRPIGWEAS